MKAIVINGSPRTDGSTSLILDQVARGLESRGVPSRRVNLSELDIRYCRGCEYCTKNGRCIQEDGMRGLIENLAEADIIVIGSPSFWGDITGNLKVFFDRSLPLCDTNRNGVRLPPGKAGLSVALRRGRSDAGGAAAQSGETSHIIGSIEHYYGHLGIRPVGRLNAEGIGSAADVTGALMEKAFSLGASCPERLQ